MRVLLSRGYIALVLCAWIGALGLGAQQVKESLGLPPRAAPTDYQGQDKAGRVTIAADFSGHAVPGGEQGPLSTEDFVVVEVGLFGPAEERMKLSSEDFSLRINGKKTTVPSQPFGMVFKSLKDPSWEPPNAAPAKSKTQVGGSGQGGNDPPPAPPKVPIELQRAMQQRVQKSALPEGDRALPVAGLVFFPYRGKTDKLSSVELIYSGPAGTATVALQP